jgi:hypothetical protein
MDARLYLAFRVTQAIAYGTRCCPTSYDYHLRHGYAMKL